MPDVVPVILSGGAGTRLWPLSRRAAPKQLQALAGEQTLIQQTAIRAGRVPGASAPIVVCGPDQADPIALQMEAVGQVPVLTIVEPEPRNTAPAVAAAAHSVPADTVLAVLPADHVISDAGAFASAADAAVRLASSGHLVTFGVVPDRAETGYGYLERGEPVGEGFRVARFVEKPDLETAQRYLDSENFWWNSGMFVFTASVYLEELARLVPQIASAAERGWMNRHRQADRVVLGEAFKESPSLSVDYAVMEKTQRALVVPLKAGWTDVGSWKALWDIAEKTAEGNVVAGDVVLEGVADSYVHSSSRLLALIGVEGLVVVETPDAVLVAAMDRVQDVKAIAEQLAADDRQEA